MTENDPAKARFLVIQMLRLGGLVLLFAGIAVIYGKVDLPREAGIAMALIGIFDLAVVPPLLARRWKSPPR